MAKPLPHINHGAVRTNVARQRLHRPVNESLCLLWWCMEYMRKIMEGVAMRTMWNTQKRYWEMGKASS